MGSIGGMNDVQPDGVYTAEMAEMAKRWQPTITFDRDADPMNRPHQFVEGDRIVFRRDGEPDAVLVVTEVQEPSSPGTQTFTVKQA